MPRELVKGQSFKVQLCNDSRLIFLPSFDWKILLFRPLPVPKYETTKYSDDLFGPCCDEDGNIGDWLAKDVLLAELRFLDKRVRIVLKHCYESEEVLTESPIYKLFTFLRPYIKCSRHPDPKKSYFYPRIEKDLLKVYKNSNCLFDVANYDICQAIIYVSNSEQFVKPFLPQAPLVLLKRRARDAFRAKLHDENSDIIDVINIDKGKLVRICRLGASNAPYPTSGSDQGVSYEVTLYDEYDKGRFKASLSKERDTVASMVKPWERMFQLYNVEEQLKILECSDIPRILIYEALKNNFDLPANIVKEAKATKISSISFSQEQKPASHVSDEDEPEDDIDEVIDDELITKYIDGEI
jgi:hypothetical protein